MIRVAVADDHPLVRDALCDLVSAQADMQVVATLADGDAVIAASGDWTCDVLVLDLSMPGTTGYAVMEHLKSVTPTVGVVVYTMYPESLVGAGAWAAGAGTWLSKRRPPSEVLAAIRTIAAGMQRGAVPADQPAPHDTLTARQRELFLLMCEGACPGDLVRRLNLSSSTVSSHLAAIRAKLGAETNGEILLYAVKMGLVGD